MHALIGLILLAAPCQLTLDIKPSDADTAIFVDGKKVGDASKPRTVKLKAGTHEIKLTRHGDSHIEEVALKPGQSLTWKFEFGDEPAPASPSEPTPTTDAPAPL